MRLNGLNPSKSLSEEFDFSSSNIENNLVLDEPCTGFDEMKDAGENATVSGDIVRDASIRE